MLFLCTFKEEILRNLSSKNIISQILIQNSIAPSLSDLSIRAHCVESFLRQIVILIIMKQTSFCKSHYVMNINKKKFCILHLFAKPF